MTDRGNVMEYEFLGCDMIVFFSFIVLSILEAKMEMGVLFSDTMFERLDEQFFADQMDGLHHTNGHRNPQIFSLTDDPVTRSI